MILLLGIAMSAQAGPLPYTESLRCEGLAAAAAKAAKPDSREWRKYWDAGLYWGLAASEAGQKAKILATRFKAEEKAQIALATTQLAAKDARALAELDTCVKRVPPLKS